VSFLSVSSMVSNVSIGEVNVEDPGHDDFELWSPSEVRSELCLFGRTVCCPCLRSGLITYFLSDKIPQTSAKCRVRCRRKAQSRNCNCEQLRLYENRFRMVSFLRFLRVLTFDIFYSEFNYMKDHNDDCVLVPGTTPLPDDDSCSNGEEYWYERTPYRIIPYSSCEDGQRPDRGTQHVCPGFKSKGSLFWFFMLILPFGFTALVGYYYWKRSGLARGYVLLICLHKTLSLTPICNPAPSAFLETHDGRHLGPRILV
jgi:hypothetical protein